MNEDSRRWALRDSNPRPLPCKGTSAEIGIPLRGNAYRRIVRRRMGFRVFGWVVLGLVATPPDALPL